ncbi:hypothetical protein G2W53_031975 [Senna tora]|uniref:Uncharacterized protein n=1 Tax=Senna tora TaxID=362788 RepID=A0A834SVV8_9FABA|nr:hypothetical protein G2W53_031975 [Senna tora]
MCHKPTNSFVIKNQHLWGPPSYDQPLPFHPLLESFWKPLFFFLRFTPHDPYEILPRSFQTHCYFSELRFGELPHAPETDVDHGIGVFGVEPSQAFLFINGGFLSSKLFTITPKLFKSASLISAAIFANSSLSFLTNSGNSIPVILISGPDLFKRLLKHLNCHEELGKESRGREGVGTLAAFGSRNNGEVVWSGDYGGFDASCSEESSQIHHWDHVALSEKGEEEYMEFLIFTSHALISGFQLSSLDFSVRRRRV